MKGSASGASPIPVTDQTPQTPGPSFVPLSDTLRAGQNVLTSGMSRRYPRGIAVKPDDPKTVFLTLGDSTPGRIGTVMRSRDAGATC